MLPEQSREISHHAIIGGSIAFVLASTELLVHFAEAWLSKFKDHPWRTAFSWFGVAVVAGLMAWLVVHFFIRLYEKCVRRLPMKIPHLRSKYVDGVWVQAVIQRGEVKELSQVTISSSEADGFTVVGKAWKFDSQTALVRSGNFSGAGGQTFDRGFGFVFKGELGAMNLRTMNLREWLTTSSRSIRRMKN